VRDILVVREDGTGLIRISNNLSDAFDPSWSPNGQWLVYISADPDVNLSKDTLIFAKWDGTCSVPVPSNVQLRGVDWSPDGQHLAITTLDRLNIVDIAASFGQAFSRLDTLCTPKATPS
jgi:WD40 repeat protein